MCGMRGSVSCGFSSLVYILAELVEYAFCWHMMKKILWLVKQIDAGECYTAVFLSANNISPIAVIIASYFS